MVLNSDIAEIKMQTARCAKQLTTKGLLDLSNSKQITTEVKGLLISFSLIVNAFRWKDIQISIDSLDDKQGALNFIRVNAWSIPTELIGIGSKV